MRMTDTEVKELWAAVESGGFGVDMATGVVADGEFIRAVEIIVDGIDEKVLAVLRYYGPKCR
jgi:hypothetical protein